MNRTSTALWMLLFALALSFAGQDQKPSAKPANGENDQRMPWLPSLQAGYAEAQRLRQLVFVRVQSESCPWCKKLEAELAKTDVQKELARWTRVALDAEKSAAEIKPLGVRGVPALRILTPMGKVAASQDGYLPAEKLLAWLREHHDAAAVTPAAELTDTEAPTAVALVRLTGELAKRDPVVREAAIRRLLPHREQAAGAVVEAFAKGPLQGRLAALELLREWRAPVGDLDPWRPETLTPARLKALQEWSAKVEPAEQPKELTPDQLADVRQELKRMLQGTEVEAAAVRERLARHGAALMPEVHARLKEAATDSARERLTALRYRLAATDALALNWPGGLERLAATAVAVRHQAVQDLARRAGAAEEPLLLELFSDSDPLVRELSLRALHEVAGARASAGLIQLLADPEPNVRAAVLKQLAEQAAPGLVPRIADYVAQEKDADLVVHAVRFLRKTKGKAAMECLHKLLAHESWRVRAESAEALGECLDRNRNTPVTELAADTYAALIEALKDADSFVISRAIHALEQADLVAAVDPLAQAAQAHPELAAAAVHALTSGSNMRNRAVPHLRRFCAHERAEVRAAAIDGLCDAAPDGAEQELRAALRDPHTGVRRTAAKKVFKLLSDVQRHTDLGEPVGAFGSGLRAITGWVGSGMARNQEDSDAAIQEVRSGKALPKDRRWVLGLSDLLRPMLTAESAEERLAAAMPLIVLGREEEATPVLLAAARLEPTLQSAAAEVLPWLPWAKRLQLFHQLLALNPEPEPYASIISNMGQRRDARALQPLWDLAAAEKVTPAMASALSQALLRLHFGDDLHRRSNNVLGVKPADRNEAEKWARPRLDSGPEMQRLVALTVLVTANPDDLTDLARKLAEDAKASPDLRRDGLQVALLLQPSPESRKTAIEALSHAEPGIRNLALGYLVHGPSKLGYLRDEQIYLNLYTDALMQQMMMWQTGREEAVLPEVPRGLKPEMLRPLLRDVDPRSVAYAGYLLALLGETDGLDPFLRYWRDHARTDDGWRRLAYVAVAAAGDDAHIHILEEIYRTFSREQNAQVRDFYWSIRALEGPNALRLRKQIRQEIGMENLR